MAKLLKAIRRGDFERVRTLIDNSADVNFQDESGITPLIEAVIYDHREIIHVLLEKGADLALKDKHGRTALIYAAMGEDIEIVKEVFEKTDIETTNSVDESGKTALIWAAENGGNKHTKALLEKGADPNILDNGNMTAIFYALQNGKSAEVIKTFIDKGAKLTIESENIPGGSRHALFYALRDAEEYTDAIITLVLNAPGVGVNIKDTSDDGNDDTPLMLAAEKHSIDVITNILNKDANINEKDGDGKTALIRAVIEERVDVVKLLLEKGADKTIKDDENMDALDYATEKDNQELITLLKDEPGAETTIPMWKGYEESYVELFNAILEDENSLERKGICPFCIQPVEWEKNCKYLSHKCKPNLRHERLYTLYKDSSGDVTWCAVCGRHGIGHAHYPLTDATEEKKPGQVRFQEGADVYIPKSCPLEGGGGPDEKLRRVNGLLRSVCEHQKDVGKKPSKEIRDQLIEDAWRAAGDTIAVEEIKSSKIFKLPDGCVLPKSTETTTAPVATIVKPPENRAIPAGMGECTVELEDCEVFIFEHLQPDDDKTERKIFNHNGVKIGKTAIRNMIKTSTGETCPIGEGCKGQMYPDEIVDILGADDEYFQNYKERFTPNKQQGGGVLKRYTKVDGSCPESLIKRIRAERDKLPKEGGKRKTRKLRTYRKIKKTRRGKRNTYRRRL